MKSLFRMGSLTFLYSLVFIGLQIRGYYCFPHVQEYLDNKLRESRFDLNHEPNSTKLSNTISSLKEVFVFEKVYKEGYIMTLFNETFFILGPELIKLSNNGSQSILRAKQVITFAKGIEQNNLAYLVLCYGVKICEFSTLSKDNDVNSIQTIVFQGVLKHFHYFVFRKQLYFAMDSSIYVWTGTYFDQLLQLPHEGSILCTFSSNMGSQIIIAEKLESNKKMVILYEIIDNDLIKLQTFGHLNNVESAISYVYANIPHVMFLRDHGATVVYQWTDSELVFIATLDKFNQARVSYAYINQTTAVFILVKMNAISLYKIRINAKELCLYDIAIINASKVLDVSISNDFKIYLLTQSSEGKTIFSSLQFDKNIFSEVNVSIETNELSECVSHLEKELNLLRIKKNDPSLVTRILNTRSLRESVDISQNPSTKIFNGKVIIKNNLHAEHIKIMKPLFFNNLNNIAWTPNKWLSKSKEQRISGKIFEKNKGSTSCSTTVLSTAGVEHKDIRHNGIQDKGSQHNFICIYYRVYSIALVNEQHSNHQCKELADKTDLLFTSTGETIENRVFIAKDIIATSMEASKINDISFKDLYLKNSRRRILGIKQFRNVNTNESSIGNINGIEAASILTLFADQKSMQYNFSKNIQIESLEVKKINKIDFDALYSSVYKAGSDSAIDGNLNIQTATINELISPNISGINSKLFLDKVTNQRINSTIEFRNIDANKIISKNINGDEITNFIHVANNDTAVVQGYVRINDIKILGDLHLNEFMSDMADTERILGTNATDLLLIYNKSVRIKGNVVIKNLILQKDVVPSIDSLPFTYDILENYWMYDRDQTIKEHVTFKSGIAVPSINLDLLNDVPFSNFIHKDESVAANISLHLETLVLNGNLISNAATGCEKLLNESVMVTGKYFITGKKIFAGNVGVNKLTTRQINGLNTINLANQSSFAKSTNTFSTIVFKENLSSETLVTKFINKHDLAQIWNSALRTNMDLNAEQIIFENVTAIRLNVGDLNGVHFNEYISSLDRIYQLKSVENVLLSNAKARDFHGVHTINSLPFSTLVNHENYDIPLHGEYHFASNLFIKDLKVILVNGINFGTLTQELMYRYWSQDITGYHTFNVIQAAHLGTPRINAYNLESLIDVSSEEPQELAAPGGLFLSSAQFAKSLYSSKMKHDVNKLTNTLRNEPTRFWTSVTVLGDVEMLDENCKVQQLLSEAIHRGSIDDTIITGQVTFENIQVKNVLLQSVNNIVIDDIIKDAVVKNEQDQIIMGKKQFIKLSARAAASLENAQIPIVNKILLNVVNDSIINKNSINSIVIRGQKTFFDGLQADQVISSNISNSPVENFVSLAQQTKAIASVKFDKLHIYGDIIVDKINSINFKDFLESRLVSEGPPQVVTGVAYFDFLNINGVAVTLPSINKILMTDVVFDEKETLTLIESVKRFENTVHCSKAFVEFINGHDITKMYQNSIFYDDASINVSSIHFGGRASLSGASITATTLNNADMDFIRDIVDVTTIMKRSENVQHNIDNIRESLLKTIQPEQEKATQYAYLDKATELQVNLPNTIDSRVSVSKPDLLLHVDAEELPSFCQLPSNCTCRNQHTVHISPTYSVSLFENKRYQRVFTYYNEDVAVNVVTNSISTSSICRKENTTGEFTTISWTTAANPNESQNQTAYVYPESIIGYINDVNFFKHNDVLYFIVSRQYDVHKNTHELDAMVMRFSQHKDQLKVIQYIPTRKSTSAKVFHAYPGIILVINSTPKMTVGTDIDGVVNVYKFNEQLESFELLRSIMDGACSNSQLLEADNESHFIVLTCRDSVKVFKYYSEFKNYYLFQVINEPYLVSATVVQPGAYERTSPLLFLSRRDSFAVFRFRFLSGFSLYQEKSIQGMNVVVPFILNSKQFLFCPRIDSSIILKVVTNG